MFKYQEKAIKHMARQDLLAYVQRAKAQGMSSAQISSALRTAGYPSNDIQEVLKATKKRVVTTRTLAFLLVGIALLILIVFFGIALFAQPKTIDLIVTLQQQSAEPGQAVLATATLTSEQSRAALVRLEFELVHVDSGRVVATRFAQQEVGRSQVVTVSLVIPKNAPVGTYAVSALAKYDNKRVAGRQSLTVLAAEEAPGVFEEIEEEFLETTGAECPLSCDDFNPCTTDYCEQGTCKYEHVDECCGNALCELTENELSCPEDCSERQQDLSSVITQAKRVVSNSPEQAAILCNSIGNAPNRDQCFVTIAKSSSRSSLCSPIEDSRTRDTCYLDFAFEMNDFSVCQEIKNRYMLTSCLSYAQAIKIPSDEEIQALALKSEQMGAES